MNHTLTLTDEKVLEAARTTLQDELALAADGYTCTTDDLLNVLVGVAAGQGTLEALCGDLIGAPDAETLRRYLNEQICVEELPQLPAALNRALTRQLPARLGRQPRDVAMDFHDRPYYGKTAQAVGLWVRGRAKDGTTRFYRIATSYVILNGLRFTLGRHFVLPGASTVTVLGQLLAQVAQLPIRLRRLLLDRGFASVEVQSYLEQPRIPALIACPIRGKQGGTRALCQGAQSYRTAYTFRGPNGQTHTAELAVCRVFTTAKRTQRLRRRATWWIFILIHLDLSPRQVRRLYRRRFGIETSYRAAAQVRGWTTSPNPAYRFLLMALGLFLLNVWMRLRWFFTQVPRRGGRYLRTVQFQLRRFAHFILQALERHYGCIHAITALAPPLL